MIKHLLALSGESLPPVTSRDSSTQGWWGRGDHSVAFVPGSTFALFDLTAFFSEFSPRVTTSKAILLKHTVLTTGGGSEHSHGTDLWKLLTIITLKEVCGKLVQKVRRTNHLATSEQGRGATYTRPAAASTWVGQGCQHHRDSQQS